MQERLEPLIKSRVRPDYPQVNRIDDNNVQWIEVNRGCKRGCEYCYADPNYKTFPIPKIEKNTVQIIGEGFLYDPNVIKKIKALGKIKIRSKVVYYGLSQGIDYRLLTEEIAELLYKYRFGLINNKGKWYRGLRIAWDWGKPQEKSVKKAFDLLIRIY